MTLILIGLGSGGCSLSRPDAYARMDAADVTGSLAKQPASPPVPTESDLAFARTAASDVLTRIPASPGKIRKPARAAR